MTYNSKKHLTKISSFGILFFVGILTSCNSSSTPGVDLGFKNANSDPYKATINSLVSTDAYGRSFGEKDVSTSDRKVGMFYFIWHGNHVDNGIFDVTKLLKECPDEVWNKNSEISKYGEFHYFSEPLYGYYCSNDPWVLTRHIELLTMSGIDYISLDLTNFGLYEKETEALLDKLLEYQNKGWKVPKVTEILNGTSPEAQHLQRIQTFYKKFYTNPKYDDIWYRDEFTGKPIITISMNLYYTGLPEEIKDNLQFRHTIWPYDEGPTTWDDASWMDWAYPQRVYHNKNFNYMSVSVAQHCAGNFGYSVNPATMGHATYRPDGEDVFGNNRGRGYDYDSKKNVSENAYKGTNLEQQWKNAIDLHGKSDDIDEVFVTGWNEWIAYKLDGETLGAQREELKHEITFCDTCNEEYSRDLEMTKDGYGDNFYLQNMRLTREYKFIDTLKYFGKYATYDIKNLDWSNARTYLDFEGDAMARNWDRADHQDVYVNNTNRNDIVKSKVANDDNNLYMLVECKDNIVIDNTKDNNLNILLSVNNGEGNNWNGYNYIINRKAITNGDGTTSIEKVNAKDKFEFDNVGEASYHLEGKTLTLAIPLEKLGIKNVDNFTVDFKVADGMSDPGNIMNYYVDGDAAPIGRLNYRYNSKHN